MVLVAASTPSTSTSGGGSSNCYWVFPIPSWAPTANVTVGGSDARNNYLIVAVQDGVIQMHARLAHSFKPPSAAGRFSKTLETGAIPSWALPVYMRESLNLGGYTNNVVISEYSVSSAIYEVSFMVDASGNVKMEVETKVTSGTSSDSGKCEFGIKVADMRQVTSGTRMN